MQVNFLDPQRGPEIYFPQGRDFGDFPDLHRWRAAWGWNRYGDALPSITLSAYPVIRLTPSGAWITKDEWNATPWTDEHGVFGWTVHGTNYKRWVSTHGSSAWAKPSKEEAILSLAVRLARWVVHLKNDVEDVSKAFRALQVLRPELREISLIGRELESLRLEVRS